MRYKAVIMKLKARYYIINAIRTDDAIMKLYRLTEQLIDKLMVVSSLVHEEYFLRILHDCIVFSQKEMRA